MQPTPLFAMFESVVDEFHAAGGMRVTAIRAPREVVRQFKAAFPTSELRYGDARIEAVDGQDNVSMRGTNVTGQEFEYPEPE